MLTVPQAVQWRDSILTEVPKSWVHDVTRPLARIVQILQVWDKAVTAFLSSPQQVLSLLVLRVHLKWQRPRTYCFLTFAMGFQLLMLSYVPLGHCDLQHIPTVCNILYGL